MRVQSHGPRAATSPQASHRFHELDSVRGIAALIVVLHHFFYMWFFSQTGRSDLLSQLYYPLIAGHESVILFFLLSGFVLSLPYLSGKEQSYPTFLARRVLRIYCPYVFALVLAVGGNAIWHGPLPLGAWAQHTWATRVRPAEVGDAVLMLGSYDWVRFNTAFWSLIQEMRISLVFPLLFVLVRRIRLAASLALAVGMCAILAVPDEKNISHTYLIYTLECMAPFVLGILMAIHLKQVRGWYARLSKFWKACVWLASAALYDTGHLFLQNKLPGSWTAIHYHLQDWPVMVGAAGFILLAVESGSAKRFLRLRAPAFLGRISYSLYLLHSTVLFSIAFLLPAERWRLAAFCIYLPVCLGLATVFCIAIEEPFTRLGRRVGRRAGHEPGGAVLAIPAAKATETS